MNPLADSALPASVRVASVQFEARSNQGAAAFEAQVGYWITVAAQAQCDFVLFPEFFTMPLLSDGGPELDPLSAMQAIAAHGEWFCTFMQRSAVAHGINIIAGTHPGQAPDGQMLNSCHVFLRDGSRAVQDKLHPTPSEREVWHIAGGSKAGVIATDRGPIGVMVCYDSEFPEMARHLVDQGALLLFVPYCTEDRRGHLRVRYCCQARTVENQCYVITAGLVGNLAGVANMDVHFAQSAVLTPSDHMFARDGVAAQAEPNVETIVIAELSLDALLASRNAGAVRNLADRRADLYHVAWTEGAEGKT
jgi:predicted amidohydrolase